MAPEVLDVVHLADDAIGVDEEGPPAGDGRPVVAGGPRGAVRLAHGVVDIGHEAVREALRLGERLVLVGRIEGDAEDRGVGFFELWGSITEPLAFDRSAGCRRRRVPPEHDPPPGQIGKRDLVSILIGKGEGGSPITLSGGHSRQLVRWWRAPARASRRRRPWSSP